MGQTADTDTVVQQIARICEIWRREADPEKIILFGSAVRGQMTRGSDLDFLVIWRGENFPNNRRRAGYLKRILPDDVTAAVDIVVLTPEQFDDAASNPRSFTATIVGEGRVLYERVA